MKTEIPRTPTKATVAFRIPFTPEEFEDLKEWAKEHDVPLSHLCRQILLDAAAA